MPFFVGCILTAPSPSLDRALPFTFGLRPMHASSAPMARPFRLATHHLVLLVFAVAMLVVFYRACAPVTVGPAPTAPTTAAPPADAVPPAEVNPASGFTPEPPPTFRAQGVRIAALNAEFMFDGVDNEGQATFPHKGDPQKARQHRDRIGRIVRMLDADVVMLAEVENAEAAQMLVDESLAGLGYTVYFVQGKDTFTGQDMALLSRVPVEATGRTDERAPIEGGNETYGVSKNLWARLSLGGVPTTVIGVHFLSRPDDASRKPSREAQAEVIRRLVVEEMAAGRAVVVLGDFNDFDDATPDRYGSQPITDVLARIKRAGDGPDDDLRNVLGEVAQAQRYTSFYDRNSNGRVDEGEFSAIDHLLLSPALYRRLREVHYVHAHDPTVATDHFPIVVTLSN